MQWSRREFLRNLAVLSGALTAGGLAGCQPIQVVTAPPAATPEAGAGEPAAAETAAEAPPAELVPVTFRLNWKITGPHAAYYLGWQRGYYRDEGLDLQLMEGNGSVNTAQLVANKSDTFGLVDAAAVIPLIVKDLPLKCVGMVSPRTSLAVVAREDSGIKTLKDLEGKTLAVTPGDSLTQIWPAVVAANNLDESKINLANVDATAKVPLVLEKKADALLGSSADQPFLMEAEGVPAVSIPFADNGVNVLNLGIWVHTDTLAEQPDVIRAFLRATQKSLAVVLEETDAAIEMLVEAKSEMEPQVAENQTRAYLEQLVSPNCPDAISLYNCPEDWTQTLEIMKNYTDLETEMTAEEFYTNEFVPGV